MALTKEPIDVLMLTLDSESFLKDSLNSIFREIPVNHLIVCDGGSKDKTISILKEYPKVELYEKPEIRTTSKCLEFLIGKVKTKWLAIIDSDIVLTKGWFDSMTKKGLIDVGESANRILAYHFYRNDTEKLNTNSRSGDMCHLIRTETLENFRLDDDYMQRYTDLFLRQFIESQGFKYEKIMAKPHIHNQGEGVIYKAGPEKSFKKIVFQKPEWVITNKEKKKEWDIKHGKAIVKYLDPDFYLIKNIKWLDYFIGLLPRQWIMDNNPKWMKRYKRADSKIFRFKKFCYKTLMKFDIVDKGN